MAELQVETVTWCPACGSAELKPWRTVRSTSRAEVAPPLVYVVCQGCGAAVLRDRVLERHLGALYADDYEPYVSNGPPRASRSRPRAVQRLVEALLANPAQRACDALYAEPLGDGRLVDFGCGNPAFLTRARGLGWDPIGVDFPESVLANIRAAGFTAHSVDEARSVLQPASVDVIRMNHVVEHLYDPRDTLAWLRGLLRPGGVLHVAVPNPAGISARLFRQHWMGMEPRHVVLYPPRTLERLLVELGFDRVSVSYESLSKDLVRSAGFFAVRNREGAVGEAMAWADNRVAARLLRPVASLAARLHLADRYHAFARA